MSAIKRQRVVLSSLWQLLPVQLTRHHQSFLTLQEACNVRAVCKVWRDLCDLTRYDVVQVTWTRKPAATGAHGNKRKFPFIVNIKIAKFDPSLVVCTSFGFTNGWFSPEDSSDDDDDVDKEDPAQVVQLVRLRSDLNQAFLLTERQTMSGSSNCDYSMTLLESKQTALEQAQDDFQQSHDQECDYSEDIQNGECYMDFVKSLQDNGEASHCTGGHGIGEYCSVSIAAISIPFSR